jgi:hypothetical protein
MRQPDANAISVTTLWSSPCSGSSISNFSAPTELRILFLMAVVAAFLIGDDRARAYALACLVVLGIVLILADANNIVFNSWPNIKRGW